ncbi:hypothetical protein BGX31_002656, partial [Mortierella sp. GBA43]
MSRTPEMKPALRSMMTNHLLDLYHRHLEPERKQRSPKASKKRGTVDIVEAIQDLSSSSAEDKEFKRKKLKIAERIVIMQEKLVEAQIRKLEAETAK